MRAPTSDRVEGRRRRLQVGLGDLAFLVVGSAAFFALARGARGFWMDWVATVPRRPMLDLDRAVGVALMAPATLIGLRLLLDAIRPSGPRDGRGFASAWRLAGAAFLAGMAVLMSAQARDDRSPIVIPVFDRAQWRVKLAALGLAIGTIGLLLGVVPARRPRRPPARRRWAMASVILAGLAGVVMLGFWQDSLIVYLVIIALDAVTHAMLQPALTADVFRFGHAAPAIFFDRGLWPSLDRRLATAGLSAAVALVACASVAHWLARDLDASDADGDRPRSWWGLLYRAATAASAWGMGAYLIVVALPGLYPALAEGLWTILRPTWAMAIVATFLALAAGLSARGVAGPSEADPSPDPPSRSPWPTWARRPVLGLARFALAAALVLVILASVARLQDGADGLPWWAPVPVTSLTGALLWPFRVTTATAIYFDPNLTPDALFLLASSVVLGVLTVRLLLTPPGAAPIDRIGRDPRRVGRFLGAWLAMAGVMLTLLPAFFLAGMAVLHFTLKAYYP